MQPANSHWVQGLTNGRSWCCRYDDAYIGFGKALAIRMKIFGENHIGIGRSYYSIGLVQIEKGDYEGAMISLEKAKAIYTRELGVEHPQTVKTNVQIDKSQQLLQQHHN